MHFRGRKTHRVAFSTTRLYGESSGKGGSAALERIFQIPYALQRSIINQPPANNGMWVCSVGRGVGGNLFLAQYLSFADYIEGQIIHEIFHFSSLILIYFCSFLFLCGCCCLFAITLPRLSQGDGNLLQGRQMQSQKSFIYVCGGGLSPVPVR